MTDETGSFDSALTRQRGAVRHKLFEPVTLRVAGVAVRAHLLDLSSTGALVHSDRPPMADQPVQVHIPGFLLAARVMWARGQRFGLRFDHPLPPILVTQILDRP